MTSNINGLVNYVTYLAGRGIRDADDPALAASEFKDEISKYWVD